MGDKFDNYSGITTESIACITPFEAATSAITTLDLFPLESVKITSMVFGILIGATAFSMVFSYTGGEEIVEHAMMSLPGDGKWGFVIFTMLAILILGFFIDFIEISYIIVPILK